MAGARAQDTSPTNPIFQLSRHGMPLRSISGPSRLLADRLTEERASLRRAEGIASPGGQPTPERRAPIKKAIARARVTEFGRRIASSALDAALRLAAQ